MAAITRGVFSVSWVTTFPALLASGGGLTTFKAYLDAYHRFGRPWAAEPSWSWFWSRYLGDPKKLRTLTADAGWEYVVPLWVPLEDRVGGPQGTTPQASAFLYPAGVAVVVRVEVGGKWDPAGFAAEVARLRGANEWTLETGGGSSGGRSLDGIATDLRDEITETLGWTPGDAPAPGVLTVAAPLAGESGGKLDIGTPEVDACVAGLGFLARPGQLKNENLLGANTNPAWGARTYVTKTGVALWHRDNIVDPPPKDSLGCLHRNQTSLVVHVRALADLVRWAHDRIQANVEVQLDAHPVLQRAVCRLEHLHAGDETRTYRSEVAQRRIEPLLTEIAAVKNVVGTL